jgi:serine/threonine protein kinase
MQVRLIGYCVEGSLFLVYEYIENGNLRQHLHGSGEKVNASNSLISYFYQFIFRVIYYTFDFREGTIAMVN